MSKQDEYLDNAARALELAMHASSSPERWRRLNLADKWLDLADGWQQRKVSTLDLNGRSLSQRASQRLRPETE